MVNGVVQFNIGQLLSRYLNSTTILPFGTACIFHHYQGSIDFNAINVFLHLRAPPYMN